MLDLIAIRRELHRIPELGFQEQRTSDRLLETITRLTAGRHDVEVARHGTGLLVHLRGQARQKTIAWRADMDGLPTTEATGLPFASERPGFMHACGHDVHMTCGLGILEQILARPQKNDFVFLFQPAEEGGGGAKVIYDAGLLAPFHIDELYALHVSPSWEPGVIATRPGTLFASGSAVAVELKGVPGHAGTPHRTIDPIVAAASFLMQAQAMVARNFDPAVGGVVLTFGKIEGGTTPNAVAASVRLEGSLRVLTREQHDLGFARLREIAEGVARATRATVDVTLKDSAYLPVINHPELTRRFMDYVRHRDDVRLVEAPVTMTSEDFGYLVNHIPGMMFWLGVGGEYPLHSNRFSPDERAIAPAVRLVGEYLSQS